MLAAASAPAQNIPGIFELPCLFFRTYAHETALNYILQSYIPHRSAYSPYLYHDAHRGNKTPGCSAAQQILKQAFTYSWRTMFKAQDDNGGSYISAKW